MKNSASIILSPLLFLAVMGCQKDLAGNAITVEAYTNANTISSFRMYFRCSSGPGGFPIGSADAFFENAGNGNYILHVDEGYPFDCFVVGGTIPANNDSVGTTVFNLKAFFTNEKNVVGFQNIERKRPHGQIDIRYEFSVRSWLE
jgi:hypothetical protein